MTSSRREQIDRLQKAIQALEEQRSVLGDAVVTASVEALQKQLAEVIGSIEPVGQQRKIATILFTDVVGHTKMIQDLDPEDNLAIMEGVLIRMAEVVETHGGHVARFQGDGFKAVFGVPTAAESDPENAVRAGLGLIEVAQEYGRELETERDLSGFNVRVGIDTGLVVVGGMTEAEDSIAGLVVNLAARLESAAPPGGVLVSHHTYQHVRGVFDVELLEPILAKGFLEPVPVYLVKRAKPRAFRLGRRGIEGIETKTIGRDDELRRLRTIYQTVVNQKQTTVVTVMAEAGVGKSRLLYEFEKWLELRSEFIWYFKGRASQQTQGISQYVLRDMLASRFEIIDSDSLAIVHEKFSAGITEYLLDKGEMKVDILGTWLGFDFRDSPHLRPIRDEPEDIKNRATLYLAQFFTAICAESPTVVLLEDVHWADSGSLDTVLDLARRRPELPLLVVCLSRPSLYERRPQWGERLPAHSRLDLTPLPAADTRALVAEILRKVDPLPQVLLDLVSGRAEGNPFYAEELVKMLIDAGVILTSAEVWQVAAEQLLELKVPDTLTGVLQARLDRLEPDSKRAAQQAAVIGRIFWDRALAALSTKGPKALPTLQAKEFVFPRSESAFAGTAEYIFKHALLRDVTYETVLKRERGPYHALIADWLVKAAQANGREDEYAALIGEHHRLAGNMELAALWFGRAGRQAAHTYAHEEAVRYLSLALQLTSENEVAGRFALLVEREKTNELQGSREAQKQDLVQLAELSEKLGRAAQARVALRQAGYAQDTSDYDQSAMHSQAAIKWGQDVGEGSYAAEGYVAWGLALWRQGQFVAAEEKFETGLRLARDARASMVEARGLYGMGVLTLFQGDFASSRRCFLQSLSLYREKEESQREGSVLNELGNVAFAQGDFAAARDYYEQSLSIRREMGDRLGEGHNLLNLGSVAHAQGDFAAAWEYHEQSLSIRKETGNLEGEGLSLSNMGVLAWGQGDVVAATDYYLQSLEIRRTIGDRDGEGMSLLNLGVVAADMGNYTGANRYLLQSLEIRRDIGSLRGEGVTLNNLGAVALAIGHYRKAEGYYQLAQTIHQDLNQRQYQVEDWAGLAMLELRQDDLEEAQRYSRQVSEYLQENPRLDGAEYPMRAFRFTWEVLSALGQMTAADEVMALAARVMQDYLDRNGDPAAQEMYLRQPHHAVLWAAWTEGARD